MKWPIPIYGGQLTVVCTPAETRREHLAQFGSRLSVRHADAALTVHQPEQRPVGLIVGMFEQNASIACHEAVHCTQILAEELRIDWVRESEGIAYLTQWFFDRIMEATC